MVRIQCLDREKMKQEADRGRGLIGRRRRLCMTMQWQPVRQARLLQCRQLPYRSRGAWRRMDPGRREAKMKGLSQRTKTGTRAVMTSRLSEKMGHGTFELVGQAR